MTCCSKKKCSEIKIKRYFLPLTGIISLLFFEDYQNYISFPLIIGFVSLIIFWNVPKIVYYTASKPLYYEDLFIDVKKLPNYNVVKKIKNRFKYILNLFHKYYYFKIHNDIY